MVGKNIEQLLTTYAPIPMCIINEDGKISKANAKISEVFIYDGIENADIYTLTGIKNTVIVEAAQEGKALFVARNERVFKIITGLVGDEQEPSVLMYFFDVTTYEKLKDMYNRERICMATVNVDNYDDLTSSAGEDMELSVARKIDKIIRAWGEKMDASITRFKDHLYFMVFESGNYGWLIKDKFSVLDEVRKIETEGDFPVSLSIGIGIGGKTPSQTDQYANDALDLALGRGGDQAVIKNVSKISYFGGKTQTVEKGNKGKSRIIAHALHQLIDQASKVIIMGHISPDMDSFGAALGVNRIATYNNKESHILINEYNEGLAELYKAAKETDQYSFINTEKAMSIFDRHTLVVVVDTSRPSIVESEELLDMAEKTVVIDHHRKSEDFINNPILAYMEPYASSASELVTEMIQYSGDKKMLTKMEAEALLAGITVDTNRFAVKTGVRTFEAASWLRRAGADTTEVKRFFQTDMDMFKTRAQCISNVEFLDDKIAMSICPGKNINAQIVNSQVADELLTIKGILASFVVGRNEKGGTVISARSLGDINVQVIMEKLGGGGHLNTAGAQVDVSPEEAIGELKKVLRETLQ